MQERGPNDIDPKCILVQLPAKKTQKQNPNSINGTVETQFSGCYCKRRGIVGSAFIFGMDEYIYECGIF